jgi:hypothetical protein
MPLFNHAPYGTMEFDCLAKGGGGVTAQLNIATHASGIGDEC